MTLSKSNKITLAICLVFLLCIGAWVAIDTKQANVKAASVKHKVNPHSYLSSEFAQTPPVIEPNYAQIIADKDKQIQHWKNMCFTLEARNAENVKEFERQYKKLERK